MKRKALAAIVAVAMVSAGCGGSPSESGVLPRKANDYTASA